MTEKRILFKEVSLDESNSITFAREPNGLISLEVFGTNDYGEEGITRVLIAEETVMDMVADLFSEFFFKR